MLCALVDDSGKGQGCCGIHVGLWALLRVVTAGAYAEECDVRAAAAALVGLKSAAGWQPLLGSHSE